MHGQLNSESYRASTQCKNRHLSQNRSCNTVTEGERVFPCYKKEKEKRTKKLHISLITILHFHCNAAWGFVVLKISRPRWITLCVRKLPLPVLPATTSRKLRGNNVTKCKMHCTPWNTKYSVMVKPSQHSTGHGKIALPVCTLYWCNKETAFSGFLIITPPQRRQVLLKSCIVNKPVENLFLLSTRQSVKRQQFFT